MLLGRWLILMILEKGFSSKLPTCLLMLCPQFSAGEANRLWSLKEHMKHWVLLGLPALSFITAVQEIEKLLILWVLGCKNPHSWPTVLATHTTTFRDTVSEVAFILFFCLFTKGWKFLGGDGEQRKPSERLFIVFSIYFPKGCIFSSKLAWIPNSHSD